jgi:hypothetical protein
MPGNLRNPQCVFKQHLKMLGFYSSTVMKRPASAPADKEAGEAAMNIVDRARLAVC